MLQALIIVAGMSISFVYAGEREKHSSSFDNCSSLLFKSTAIVGVSRVWNNKCGTWTYNVTLTDEGKLTTATCEHDPSKHRTPGRRIPVALLHNPEYSTCYIKLDSMKPEGWRCFTSSPEQYRLVELAHKEQRMKMPKSERAVLEQMEEKV